MSVPAIMKFVVLLSCLLAVFAYATAEPESADDEMSDISVELDQDPEVHVDDNGNFVLKIVDKDGTTYEEEGMVLTNEKTGKEVVISKKGTFSARDKDGKVAQFAYDIMDPDTINLQ